MDKWSSVLFLRDCDVDLMFICFVHDSLEIDGENITSLLESTRESLSNRDLLIRLMDKAMREMSDVVDDGKKCGGDDDDAFAYVLKDAHGVPVMYSLYLFEHAPKSWTNGLPPGCEKITGNFLLV
jgi:hypothetical protein